MTNATAKKEPPAGYVHCGHCGGMGFLNPLTDEREVCPACGGKGVQVAPKTWKKPKGTYGIDKPIQTFTHPQALMYCPMCIDEMSFQPRTGHCRNCGDSSLILDFTLKDQRPPTGQMPSPMAPMICLSCAQSAAARIPSLWIPRRPEHCLVVFEAIHKPGGLWKLAICSDCLIAAIQEVTGLVEDIEEAEADDPR